MEPLLIRTVHSYFLGVKENIKEQNMFGDRHKMTDLDLNYAFCVVLYQSFIWYSACFSGE